MPEPRAEPGRPAQDRVGRYEPALYDLVTPETLQGDLEWYRRKARDCSGPVLELGAGTGRVTLGIARDGASIHALESDPGMLTALRRKIDGEPPAVRERVVVVDGDMRSFRLSDEFALVIAPFRVFLHNLTRDDQASCLRCVREHLRPGGQLAFNVFHPSLEYMARHAGALAGVWRWAGTFPQADGGSVVRSEASRYDTVRQRVHSQHRYDEFGPDGTLRRTFVHQLELAYLYPADIRRLLEQTGFRSIQISGGFDGRPFEQDTDELVVEASR